MRAIDGYLFLPVYSYFNNYVNVAGEELDGEISKENLGSIYYYLFGSGANLTVI